MQMATDVWWRTAAVVFNLLGLFAPEDGGTTDLWNVANCLPVDVALRCRRLYSPSALV